MPSPDGSASSRPRTANREPAGSLRWCLRSTPRAHAQARRFPRRSRGPPTPARSRGTLRSRLDRPAPPVPAVSALVGARPQAAGDVVELGPQPLGLLTRRNGELAKGGPELIEPLAARGRVLRGRPLRGRESLRDE